MKLQSRVTNSSPSPSTSDLYLFSLEERESAERGRGIVLLLDEEPKRWEGITDEDKALWAKTYPGVDVERELQEMIAYWDAQPRSALKLNWKRTIVNRLKWVQDHGGTKGQKGDRMTGIREWAESRGLK